MENLETVNGTGEGVLYIEEEATQDPAELNICDSCQ